MRICGRVVVWTVMKLYDIARLTTRCSNNNNNSQRVDYENCCDWRICGIAGLRSERMGVFCCFGDETVYSDFIFFAAVATNIANCVCVYLNGIIFREIGSVISVKVGNCVWANGGLGGMLSKYKIEGKRKKALQLMLMGNLLFHVKRELCWVVNTTLLILHWNLCFEQKKKNEDEKKLPMHNR